MHLSTTLKKSTTYCEMFFMMQKEENRMKHVSFLLKIKENHMKRFCLQLRWMWQDTMLPWNLGHFCYNARLQISNFIVKLSLHTSTEYPRDFTSEYNSSYFLIRFQSIHSFWHLQKKEGEGKFFFFKYLIPIHCLQIRSS